MITTGKQISIEYKVTLPDGTEVDNNEGNTLTFIQGSQTILPSLEDALEGAVLGDHLHIELGPDDAFGPLDDEYFQNVSVDMVPEDLRFFGAELSVEDDEGQVYQATLHKLEGDEAVLNFNHPLAGRTLVFDMTVVKIEENPHLN